jgi:SAM-dependent methyltransferase
MVPQVQFTDVHACERFYDDRYARGYMDDWPAARLERVRTIIGELELPAAGTAIDFGCGTGVFTAVLRDCLPGWRIVGLDISRTAIEIARRAVPGCAFHYLEEAASSVPLAACPPVQIEPAQTGANPDPIEPGSADLLFTHHVLEHVADLEHTCQKMAALAKERAWMLHILPCGNPGSFEHDLCRLREGGIDPMRGGRFFYEDEGHLCRLTSDQLTVAMERFGFRVVQEWYSFHQFEAVHWLTDNGVRFVLNLCDPRRAVDSAARRRLKCIRRQLLPMAVIKSIARRRSPWVRPCASLAQLLVKRWTVTAEREWQAMRDNPAGSEMHVVFRRG